MNQATVLAMLAGKCDRIIKWSWIGTLMFLLVGATQAADPPLPVIPATNFNITSFGAFGDGISNNATAIQNTINAASAAGGGTVIVAAVGILTNYLSGPVNLASKVSLQINAGTKLQMLPYTNWPGTTTFINGSGLNDVEITGSGTIDGNAGFSTGGVTNNWWQTCGSSSCQITRPNFINFSGCTRVLIQNVTLQNPPTFHIMAKGNNVNLTIQNIFENTIGTSPNTDGMDIGSSNVLVRNCTINVGDDNIEIGGSSALVADMTVSNCSFGTGHGVSLGSLVNGAGGGVHNLLVSNCTFNGTDYGIRMKSDRDRGGICENLRYLDITMTNVDYPIVIYSYYNSVGTPNNITPFRASTDTVHAVTGTTPIWRNITISNVTATSLTGNNIAGIIWGVPEMLVSNVALAKVNLVAPTKVFNIYNATAIKIVDSSLNAPNTTTNTLNLYNADVTLTNSLSITNISIGGLAVPPTNNTFSFFNAKAVIADTNVLGAGTITLGGSTLSFSQTPVTFSNNVRVVSNSRLVLNAGTNTFSGALTGAGPLILDFSQPSFSGMTAQGDWSGFTGSVIFTNLGTLSFNQGSNIWGGASTAFDVGSGNSVLNNRSTNSITIFLGALTGGSLARLRGSDQAQAGVDTYVIGGLNSNTTFSGVITNGTVQTVALTKIGSGTFTLGGTNTYTSGTIVSNGTLLVNGIITGTVTVASGATLGGTGILRGPVTVNGTLAPGTSAGTLAISNSLVATGILQYELGTNSDLTVVRSNLTLSGTLSVVNAGGFTNTSYTLLTYGGTLSYSGLAVGNAPAGYAYLIDTGTVGQVKLSVLTPFQGWQMQYFNCTNCPAAAGNADADGDGMSNTNEFLAGTNPTNSASALQIVSETPQGNNVIITWMTAGGRTNVVQFTAGDGFGSYATNFTDLSDLVIIPGSGDVLTNFPDVGGATNSPSRYYRIRVSP